MSEQRKPLPTAPASPPETDDCFAQLDAALNALATELEWEEAPDDVASPVAPPVPAVEIVEPPPAAMAARLPEVVAAPPVIGDDALDAIIDFAPASAPAPRPHDADGEVVGDSLEGYQAAFDQIDATLSGRRPARSVAVAGPDASIPPVFEVDPEWFGGGEPAGTVRPPSRQHVQQLRLAPRSARHDALALAHGAEALQPAPAGASRLDRLVIALQGVAEARGGLRHSPDRAILDDIELALPAIQQLCGELNLQTARVRIEFAMHALQASDHARLGVELDELLRHVRHDLQSWSLWQVAASRARSLNLAFGDKVRAAFPSAQSDISEAGICVGLARYTAAAFHMTRVASLGVRALASASGAKAGAEPGADNLDALMAAIDGRIAHVETWPNGQARRHALEFFTTSRDDARVARDMVRRLAPGSQEPIDEHDAMTVFNRTRALLTRLAEHGLTEWQVYTLGRKDF